MRLLIGWIIRSILVCAVVSAAAAALVYAGSHSDGSKTGPIEFWTAYLWTFGLTSTGCVLYWIADYLIDYDDWQREVGKR